MKELLRLFTQIALLRRGPQDVPASRLLLALTVLGYFIVNFAVSLVLPPIPGPWPLHLVVDVLFMLAWFAVLLRVAKRPERYLQTTTAVFGYQAVLSPLWIASGWVLQHFAEDGVWQLPATIVALALVVWMVAAGGHVLKSALEWSMPAGVALTILQILAGQLLLLALFSITA